jgi:hypothetical protein
MNPCLYGKQLFNKFDAIKVKFINQKSDVTSIDLHVSFPSTD